MVWSLSGSIGPFMRAPTGPERPRAAFIKTVATVSTSPALIVVVVTDAVVVRPARHE